MIDIFIFLICPSLIYFALLRYAFVLDIFEEGTEAFLLLVLFFLGIAPVGNILGILVMIVAICNRLDELKKTNVIRDILLKILFIKRKDCEE